MWLTETEIGITEAEIIQRESGDTHTHTHQEAKIKQAAIKSLQWWCWIETGVGWKRCGHTTLGVALGGVTKIILLLCCYHRLGCWTKRGRDNEVRKGGTRIQRLVHFKPQSEASCKPPEQHSTIPFLFLLSHNHWPALCVQLTGTMTVVYSLFSLFQSFHDCRAALSSLMWRRRYSSAVMWFVAIRLFVCEPQLFTFSRVLGCDVSGMTLCQLFCSWFLLYLW